ncbi:glycerophosphoryl diester phosphodiesterase [Salinihabitans flavidus]|uniref:Glycerophosphoryl diester phosphodiesterase n=1 Tax=Salinihabitans flavidus TaxID=569882 RepID=A0A1H8U2N8_9RHOB|nr:glycerophosphodiester phosphodiesterase family protein [Salinihabitans flavidus]SEO97540.1 glycerophosphoryl diester phosphodiesterase [Salinihabitans flavidus]
MPPRPTPRIFGHRGAPCVLPENTIAGFEHALDSGADGIELDLLITRDGTPVVTHNPRLMADTTRDAAGAWLGVEGPDIATLSYDELAAFDVGGARPGSAYASRFPAQGQRPGTPVPRLTDVIPTLYRRNTDVLFEIKTDPRQASHLPLSTQVSRVLDAIRDGGMEDRAYLHAFDWAVLEEAARQAPHIRRSHLTYTPPPGREGTFFRGSPWLGSMRQFGPAPDMVAAAGGAAWSPYVSDLTVENLARAQALGLEVLVWTVTEPGAIRRAIDMGVDGIISDDPARAVAVRDAVGAA